MRGALSGEDLLQFGNGHAAHRQRGRCDRTDESKKKKDVSHGILTRNSILRSGVLTYAPDAKRFDITMQ